MNSKIDISGNQLKIIACISMLIDHIGVALIAAWMQVITDASLYHAVYLLYRVLRGVGRLAFPLYIFLLVEGFFYTHSRKNYLGRLALFLVLSEIPFDMALMLSNSSIASGTFYTLAHQNIFFTLVIGFVGMMLCELIDDTFEKGGKREILFCIVMVLCCLLAEHLNTDYGMAGILAVFGAYYLRDISKEAEMGAIVLLLTIFSSTLEVVAVADIFLVHFYHGNRGEEKINKWVFYGFYPVHLLLLAALKMLLF